jgi:uncharacterized sulfatase
MIDAYVGRILESLERNGLSEDTIVVFTSDHGEYMGEKGLMAKGGFLWEGLINVPCIVRYPRQMPKGKEIESLFSFVDMVPTLLDYCGVDAKEVGCDGVSQREVWSGTSDKVREHVTVMHVASAQDLPDQWALVEENWKLVYYSGAKVGELYDLKSDPREKNNLYSDAIYNDKRISMIERLLASLLSTPDQTPLLYSRKASSRYGVHPCYYREWKPELDALRVMES